MTSKTQEEVQEWIVQWLVDVAEVSRESIELDKPFADYRLDSLTAVEFSGDIEEWLDITVTATVLWNHPTLRHMTIYLAERSSGQTEVKKLSEPTTGAVEAILAGVENITDEEAKKLLEE